MSSKKITIIASLLIIIACFLPWWGLICTFIPSSGERSYAFFISNPFFDSFVKVLVMYTEGSFTAAPSTILSGFTDTSFVAPFPLLLAVIIALIGGVIGLISFGNKKIAIVGSLVVLVGVILFIIFIATGTIPGGIDPTYFTDNGLNAFFGSFTRDVLLFHNANDLFGISFGPILALVGGLALLYGGFKGND
ncbi:MAG: hypothetical protein GF329_11195 [Candidatus Lokiarchaeota archaeon]|nr:hypothetical protein [Candidatus Lokiarchaeota archaeon]